MNERCKTVLAITLMILLALSCFRIDNIGDVFAFPTASLNHENAFVMTTAETFEVNRGYSRIEQQDYLNATNSTRLSSTLFRRFQNADRSRERHEMSVTILDVVSKVVLFSFIMILFAANHVRLSMPFQCLLYYIHDMDGKKKIF